MIVGESKESHARDELCCASHWEYTYEALSQVKQWEVRIYPNVRPLQAYNNSEECAFNFNGGWVRKGRHGQGRSSLWPDGCCGWQIYKIVSVIQFQASCASILYLGLGTYHFRCSQQYMYYNYACSMRATYKTSCLAEDGWTTTSSGVSRIINREVLASNARKVLDWLDWCAAVQLDC